jgi:GT2 family glycosyltransferase
MNVKRSLLVVTPTLGRSPWLSRTVKSVEAQAGPHAMHVLVAPPQVHDSLARIYPRCILVADIKSNGVYPAINLGIASATGAEWSWFTWINDDDELTPGFAAHLARTMEYDGKQLDAPWTYGHVRLSNSDADDLGSLSIAHYPSDILKLAQAGVNPLNQQGMLVPRAWVEGGGPLREDLKICADVDFWLRAVVAGAKFRYSPETIALFRLRVGQISGDVARHQEEFNRVVKTVAGTSRGKVSRWAARARYRISNAGIYADRVRRCGWKSGFDLLERPARRHP